MKQPVLSLAIMIGGIAIAAGLIATGPRLDPSPPQESAPLVRVVAVEPAPHELTIRTFGTVVPRTESELIPEVSGPVTRVSSSMAAGGFFSKGDVLFQVDPLTYELALEQARAGLARAQSELANAERGYARQVDLASKQSTSEAQQDDALNRLRIAEASLAEAKARLALAERDLQRTSVVAPFDGRVRSEHIDVGQFVNRGNSVATIYATDVAEVRLPVQDEELAFLDIPLSGVPDEAHLPVTLTAEFAGEMHSWQGRIVRTEGELDPRTRMVNLVAAVQSPYAQAHGTPLAVGLFVEAAIAGRLIDSVVELPRAALQRDSEVFVVDAADRLQFRSVDVLRIVDNTALIRGGLKEGDRVCVATISGAVEGMLVRPVSTAEGAKGSAP